MILSAGKRMDRAAVQEIRSILDGAQPDIELVVVSLRPPIGELPVARHLVTGPHLRVGATTAMVPTTRVTEEVPQASTPHDPSFAVDDDEPAEAEESVTEQRPKPVPLVWGPARVKAAVGWRVRRLRRHPVARRVRKLVVPSGALSFALTCLRQPSVIDLARTCDIIVAVDTPSHQAAWAIARKVPGPQVTAGIVAARRLLTESEA
jgi:hypothetical protein